jgi:phosphate transport system protein
MEHTFKQFDIELENLRNRVLQMGGLVEQQVRRATEALYSGDAKVLQSVVADDSRVNDLETEIEEACIHLIAKRQPTAVDLRMIVTVQKIVGDLERIGDKAQKIARLSLGLHDNASGIMPGIELRPYADLAVAMLTRALDAFARLDLKAAGDVIHQDEIVNSRFSGIMREIVTYMMEDPRTISRSLDVIFMAKAIERIGDHARNVAEYVVYMVKGQSVRHYPLDRIDAEIAKGN